MNKKQLKIKMLSDRTGLSNSKVLENSKKLIDLLKSHFLKNSRFLFYFPVKNEIDLLSLARETISKNKTAAFPSIESAASDSIESTASIKNPEMLFRIVRDLKNDFPNLIYRIPQPGSDSPIITPQKNDVVFVPGLAFDRKGNRLGYGGGFFDRFLKTFPGISVGVCHHIQLKNTLNILEHDIAVDYICTEKEFISCRSMSNEVNKNT